MESTVIERAREALEQTGHDGEFVGLLDDGPGLFGVQFTCALPGYHGWHWTVSASEFDGAVTINDIVLLPGPESIVAPAWTPYKDRVQPDDLGPGDVLPPDADDIRLVPAWSAGDGDDTGVVDRHFAREIGLGRDWVLSLEGREDAADRWYDGEHGPESPVAKQASKSCVSCGFLVSLAGDLADRFGVCANRMSKSDGHVVALNHGCGAHSGSRPKRSASARVLPTPVYDTLTVETVEIEPVVEAVPDAVSDSGPDSVSDSGPETDSGSKPEPVADTDVAADTEVAADTTPVTEPLAEAGESDNAQESAGESAGDPAGSPVDNSED